MKEIFIGLILAFITGLFAFGLKFPVTYKKISSKLSTIAALITTGITIWNIAMGKAYMAIADIFPYEKHTQIRQTLESLEIPMSYVFGSWVAFNIYLFAIYAIPKYINEQEKQPAE